MYIYNILENQNFLMEGVFVLKILSFSIHLSVLLPFIKPQCFAYANQVFVATKAYVCFYICICERVGWRILIFIIVMYPCVSMCKGLYFYYEYMLIEMSVYFHLHLYLYLLMWVVVCWVFCMCVKGRSVRNSQSKLW